MTLEDPRFLELAHFQSGHLRGNVRSQVGLVLQTLNLADIFNNVKTWY